MAAVRRLSRPVPVIHTSRNPNKRLRRVFHSDRVFYGRRLFGRGKRRSRSAKGLDGCCIVSPSAEPRVTAGGASDPGLRAQRRGRFGTSGRSGPSAFTGSGRRGMRLPRRPPESTADDWGSGGEGHRLPPVSRSCAAFLRVFALTATVAALDPRRAATERSSSEGRSGSRLVEYAEAGRRCDVLRLRREAPPAETVCAARPSAERRYSAE